MSENESPFFARDPIGVPRALTLLADGEIELVGRMPYSSNATFLVNISDAGLKAQGIYKPRKGERPLWDFPSGLYRREVAAFHVAQELGWDIVPPTVVREDAPLETGAIQLFMPHYFSEHYFTLYQTDKNHDTTFRQICAFDLVINNTDRKSGHCILGTDGRIWAIDHGVAFHHQFKLRTVLWDFASEPLPEKLRADLQSFADRGVSSAVADLLNPLEQDAMLTRTKALAKSGTFPKEDSNGHRWPWPLI